MRLFTGQKLFNEDVIILTETFLTEAVDVPNYYGVHAPAIQRERGRSSGGVSCLFKDTIGTVTKIHKEENLIILFMPQISIVGVYIATGFHRGHNGDNGKNH